MAAVLIECAIALGLLALLRVSWIAGRRIGLRLRADGPSCQELPTIQAAILALLGLLLGFCFAGAASRFVERQDIIVHEANAIGTLYQRADLLPTAQGERLRAVVRAYAGDRLKLFERGATHGEGDLRARLDERLKEAWRVVVEGVESKPEHALLIVPACNEVIDLLGKRNAADDRHLPLLVVMVLMACAAASVLAIGLSVQVADGRVRVPGAILVLLIAATLWVTIDLDFPRVGFARVSMRPLASVAERIGVEAPLGARR